jgi:hypothetical protein
MTRGAHDDEEHDKKEAKAENEHIPEGEVIYRAIRQDGAPHSRQSRAARRAENSGSVAVNVCSVNSCCRPRMTIRNPSA